jgi:nucleotide-binding universal stress UspA family protein
MKILLAIDGSACSAAATDGVANQFFPTGTEVLVLTAVDWLRHLSLAESFAEGADAAGAVLRRRDAMVREARELVEGSASRLRSAGFIVSTCVRTEGDPRVVILDVAESWPADLIVLGSHGRTGIDRFVLGSVAEHVVRHARCSVEVIRRSPTALSAS